MLKLETKGKGKVMLKLETHLGDGEAEIVDRNWGSGIGTKWSVSLPWESYVFFGGPKSLRKDVAKRDRAESHSHLGIGSKDVHLKESHAYALVHAAYAAVVASENDTALHHFVDPEQARKAIARVCDSFGWLPAWEWTNEEREK